MAIEQNLLQMLAKTINDILTANPDAVGELVETRVKCNDKIETDTLAIPFTEKPGGPLSLGSLGLMNAVAGLHGLKIVGHYSDDNKLLRFSVEVLKDACEVASDAEVQGEHGPELREAVPPAEEVGEGSARAGEEGRAG